METPSSPDKIEYNFVKYSNCLILAQRQAIDSLKLPQWSALRVNQIIIQFLCDDAVVRYLNLISPLMFV